MALEAGWRAALEVARGSVDVIRRRLAGGSVDYDPPVEAVRQIGHFLESLSLETTDLGAFEPRLVRLSHALDHLTRLNDDLTGIPPAVTGQQPPAGFEAGARALGAWLDATADPNSSPDPAVFRALEEASQQLGAERNTGRGKILEDVALQRTPAATARADLDALLWAESALHHAWRLAELLRIASGK